MNTCLNHPFKLTLLDNKMNGAFLNRHAARAQAVCERDCFPPPLLSKLLTRASAAADARTTQVNSKIQNGLLSEFLLEDVGA